MRLSKWFVISCLCVLFLSVTSAPMSYAKVQDHYEQQQSVFIDSDPIDHDPQDLIVDTSVFIFAAVVFDPIANDASPVHDSQSLHLSIRAPPIS
jgi:hypothetical protein